MLKKGTEAERIWCWLMFKQKMHAKYMTVSFFITVTPFTQSDVNTFEKCKIQLQSNPKQIRVKPSTRSTNRHSFSKCKFHPTSFSVGTNGSAIVLSFDLNNAALLTQRNVFFYRMNYTFALSRKTSKAQTANILEKNQKKQTHMQYVNI